MSNLDCDADAHLVDLMLLMSKIDDVADGVCDDVR